MFNRESSFAKMELESLFFAFYYQQCSQQQYLAAIELKQRGWLFNKRFSTWIKKEIESSQGKGSKASRALTLYFDFEHEFKVRVSTSEEISFDNPRLASQIENELIPPPAPSSSKKV